MRGAIATLTVAAAFMAPSTALAADNSNPGCRFFGFVQSFSAQGSLPDSGVPFGQSISFYAHLLDGDPLGTARRFECPGK